jgi:hypothetical protein
MKPIKINKVKEYKIQNKTKIIKHQSKRMKKIKLRFKEQE